MKIHAGDYVMLKSVDEVKHLYKEWKPFFMPKNALGKVEVFVDTGDKYLSRTMLKAMDAVNVYRVAWADNDRVCVYLDNGAYIFDKKCIKGVYKYVQVD